MTEAEWNASAQPDAMLYFVGERISSRQSRLFAVACMRRLWRFFTNERTRRVVELLEQYADGQCSDGELHVALRDAELVEGPWVNQVAIARFHRHKPVFAGENLAATYRTVDDINTSLMAAAAGAELIHDAARAARVRTGLSEAESWQSAVALEQRIHCGLLRDIVSNPFRRLGVGTRARTANAASIAEAIYTDRAFDRLPILADALEDAGCTERDILDHCRQPGEHVRGCWVVDLVLGKS